MFLTATEALWRHAVAPNYSEGGIIVAIGYPLTEDVYDYRRDIDLTPPHTAEDQNSATHSQEEEEKCGGADLFLDFILNVVKPFVRSTIFPSVEISQEALFGHSYGGLFALHALFTRPAAFDCLIAASPSIYWHDCMLLSEERAFRERTDGNAAGKCSLMMFYGSHEQDPPQWPGESSDDYQKRIQYDLEEKVKDNAVDMYGRLKENGKLRSISLKEYPAEDHSTVVACSISRGLTTFFEERCP